MSRSSLLCMSDIVREDHERKQQRFLRDSEEFPCLFNLGHCKLDIGSRKYTGIDLGELDVSKNKWQSLQEDLNNDSEVSECDKVVFKENLLTYVYAELGEFEDALKLNKRIQDEHGMNNLVALVNAAFLFYRKGNFNRAYGIIDDLKKLKSHEEKFDDLKTDAILELGYAFRKLAGAKNLQLSISLLEFVLLFRPRDEQIQLMLAIVQRRCVHFHIYSADSKNISRHDFALKAAKSLCRLGTTSDNKAFKAAALIELAYLKHEDDKVDEYNCSEEHSNLSREEWFQIVQQRTWKQLCEEAIEVCDDGPSEKVLKIAGQLYRYYGANNEFLKKSEQLLKKAILKRPSNRAHHHLGLTYRKMAINYEWGCNTNQEGAVGGYDVKNDRLRKPNGFVNNTIHMKHTNRGNYQHRFAGRQEHDIYREDFQTSRRGAHPNRGNYYPSADRGEFHNNVRGAHPNRRNDYPSADRGEFHNNVKSAHTYRRNDYPSADRGEFHNNARGAHPNTGNYYTSADRREFHNNAMGAHTNRGNYYTSADRGEFHNNVRSAHPNRGNYYPSANRGEFHNNAKGAHPNRGNYYSSADRGEFHNNAMGAHPNRGNDSPSADRGEFHNNAMGAHPNRGNDSPSADRGEFHNNAMGAHTNRGNDYLSADRGEFHNNAMGAHPNRGNYYPSADRGEFHNNARGAHTNRGNDYPSADRGEFHNNARGAAGGYARSGYHIKPKKWVSNTVEMIHPNRGHNRQGFINQLKHHKHREMFDRNTQGAEGCKLKVLPEPPPDKSPKKLEKILKYIAKVPDQFKPFRKDNPFIDKAIQHMKQAAELSCWQNKVAVYDFACILVQAEDYEKSKETCRALIRECTSSKTLAVDPVYLVNAFNLYGICSAKQAEVEVNQANKERLVEESDEKLTLAVRLASHLAAAVPELEMCATDLWKAFRTLEKKFTFEGQKESREKLFRICEFISDCRCLEAVDAIVSQDPDELEKIEVIEQCLQRYLNMKAYDSALLFRDLINLRPAVRSKLLNSKVYKQLMLEVAEGKLDETHVKREAETCLPDLVWKQLFNDEFHIAGSSKKYDVIIVSDVDEDYLLKQGMMCNISEYLKQVLLKTFGLSVARAHEESYAGCDYLEEQLQIISSSRVSLFVLTNPYIASLSLASEVADLRISESEHSVMENATVDKERVDSCPPEKAMTDNQNKNDDSISRMYERIINATISNCMHHVGATRMLFIVPDSLKPEDLPQAVRGLPTVALSQSEIETMTGTAQGRSNQHCIKIRKKIFRAVLGKLKCE